MIDKSKWGTGPWQDELDRKEWQHKTLSCLAIRQEELGHWCGYVAVPPTHPYWNTADYMELDVHVHGGLTYGSLCRGVVCHVPRPGEPDNVFWLGFDCAHGGDYSPGYTGLPFGDHYWTLDEVVVEVNYLADQLVIA